MNVLFILADDLGIHDLSCTGSSFYETPNIDRIANEGTIFSQGYATCQVCSPSRASIMSGKFTARHGITDWIGAKTGDAWSQLNRRTKLLPPEYEYALPHEYKVLPEVLRDAGYHTFFAGKWHLGSEGSYPEDHGFNINIGGWDKGSPIGGYFSPYQNPKLENQKDGEQLSMRLARETADFITANKDTGFFAFLSFYAVHGPIQTSKEQWHKYREKAVQQGIEEQGYKMERRLPIRQVQDNPVYAGLVSDMDMAIGHVLNKLDELGLSENTIVIFTSDNGGVASGDNYSTSNLPLRGGKGYQWEGGIREPFFIKAPGIKDKIATTAVPATGADFYPTILELLGLDLMPEEHQDGQSLLKAMQGQSLSDRPLYWHYPHYGNQGGDPSSMIRLGDWKLIHYWEDGSNELYRLSEDLEEQFNVAAEHPQKVQELWTMLSNYLSEVGAQLPTEDPRYDQQLEAKRLKMITEEWLPGREKERLNYLSEDYVPKQENWWGSDVIEE